jgi:hypothetical protein
MDEKFDKFQLSDKLATLLQEMKDSKPNDKSEIDSRYTIVITELEKAYAYFYTYVIEMYP